MSRRVILVVDDSATSRAALSSMLRDDYEVHTANDGLEGLSRTALLHPDLILLDVQMPVMDGRQTCRTLRLDPATHDTPVILVTALDGEEDVEMGYTCGATDYICKPVDRDELLAKVQTWLDAARPVEPS